MRNIVLLLTLLLSVAGLAQERVVERTYLSTDRDVYVAGETLWYSAFCLDAARGTFSPVSSVAYVELHGAGTMVASGKVALTDGRGAGSLAIPATLPTGNYRLVAYTAQNKAELDYDYNGLASKTVSVFNVFSGERVKDGVEIVPEAAYAVPERPMAALGGVSVTVSGDSLVLENRGGTAATLSLSVTHDDGIAPNANPTIADFTALAGRVGPRRFDNRILPEYEGEIIRGHVSGFSEAMIPELAGHYAFISTPSDQSDVYASVIDAAGRVSFYTGNIYGNKEYICEIEGVDPSFNGYVELESPFVNAPVAATEKLRLSESLREALRARGVAMQIGRHFTADTLLDALPVRRIGLFGDEEIVYVLDDYTRFTTMEEVLVEFVSELRARRRSDGARDIKVRLSDNATPQFSQVQTLMMIDGVPVFDQQKIMDYDPLLVESIHIYPQTYYIGTRSFEGIANFVTYRHNLPGFRFGGNVRVIDYQGVAWPMAFTGEKLRGGAAYPDYRQTVYWHPLLTLAPGERRVISCKMPDYAGRFKVSLEGLSADGTPQQAETSFTWR